MRAAWLGPLLLASCGGGQEGGVLRLLEFRQRDFESVALNEELQFYFSADLDRSSVTSDSVRILDEEGHEVPGERSVRRNALTFLPELPCASDLSDGGLRPGTGYRVVLGGFPRPDGIRSASGALLSASLVLSFRTAEIGGKESPLFLDPFLKPLPLRPLGRRSSERKSLPLPRQETIELEDGILVLESSEALDPSSVPGARFELYRIRARSTPVPIVARLIENRRNHALLLLEPQGSASGDPERLPPADDYLLLPGRELRTLGGREVEPGWQYLNLTVPEARVEIDFLSKDEQSGDPPPGCDGTALWNSPDPGLHVRYPAAAGDGSAGVVELESSPEDSDVRATRLRVPAGAVVDLSDHTGPVVLRSQTSLEVRGRIVRRGTDRGEDPPAKELERAEGLPEARRPTFSSWIERLIHPDDPGSRGPWTVLIAGGDIRVPKGASIEVDSTLVLVAGGRIRVEGSVLANGILWRTPDGGAGNAASHVRNAILPLVLDPPEINPLRTKLTLGALTGELHWTPRTSGWRPFFIGEEAGGRLGARFFQTLPGSSAERQTSDPSDLGPEPVRVLVVLEIPPGHGDAWNPPRFERLRLEGAVGPLPGTKP